MNKMKLGEVKYGKIFETFVAKVLGGIRLKAGKEQC